VGRRDFWEIQAGRTILYEEDLLLEEEKKMVLRKFTIVANVLAVFSLSIFGSLIGGIFAAHGETVFGEAQILGADKISTYATLGADGRPTAFGLVFTRKALDGLPQKKNMTSRCFDADNNGKINDSSECEGDYELRLAMPAALAGRADFPFKWVGFNWNPEGHVPPGVYDLPHFDMHFYMVPQGLIDGIRVGGCALFINCKDREKALIPVDKKYIHPDHISVGATVSMMGDHLLNSKSPELARKREDKKKFTHTWIFGSYEGRITFYETMMTREFLLSRARACFDIKQPRAWQRSGIYPTRYCIRHDPASDAIRVSLEDLVLRAAN
jgi:hypothetical protein